MSSSQQDDGATETQSSNPELSLTQTSNVRQTIKRKAMKERSPVWLHFEKIKDENGKVQSAKCNYCPTVLRCDTRRNGTSSLNAHMRSCMSNPQNQLASQTLLNLQPSSDKIAGVGTLTPWKFSQDDIRVALANMIIVDELPFKFVEGDGFRKLMSRACPRFQIPSRWTVSRDCFQLYGDERSKLKSFLKSNCQRVSLTTDTWTSLQRINYMCITGHFIDNEWNLHKRILSFVPIYSHKGDYIGKALENCLVEWGLKNVFTITVDNASSNDTAIAFLKKKMLKWHGSIASCKYLHMRCIAHVINLVVSEGLKDAMESVKHVRDAVRYIRNSPARLKWWKMNSDRFPVLARMARDILAVPVSTVASESAFSTGGRILDAFRSSLTPKIVEALICAGDWLRNPRIPLNVEEQLDDIETLEKDLHALVLGVGGATGSSTSPNA